MSSEFVLYSRKFVRNGLMGENDRLKFGFGTEHWQCVIFLSFTLNSFCIVQFGHFLPVACCEMYT